MARKECNFGVLSDEESKIIIDQGPKKLALAFKLLGLTDEEGDFQDFLIEQLPEEYHKFIKSDDKTLGDLYGDFIHSYLYNYKDGVGEDPNIVHEGPTAQEIEKVAPDLIKEDTNGLKRVNTERLPLTNASAIADLAREVKDIQDELSIGKRREFIIDQENK